MKLIHRNIPIFDELINKQTFDKKKKYRLTNFAFVHPYDNGYLIHNNLTKQFVYLTEEEYNNILNNEELIEDWLLVPEDFNDKQFSDQVRSLLTLIQKPSKAINHYTIFTTTDCNARCFYCYEKGIKKMHMPHKVAEDVGKYIIDHCNNEKVTITWFGGEPLYNQDAIDTICNILNDAHIDFTSKMISNSYLFDEFLVDRAVKSWHLKSIQITLDGTEKLYNKTKHYIYDNVNAFERVFNNIKTIVSREIKVTIRLNITSKNAVDLGLLIDKIHDEIGVYDNLMIYVHTLYESTGLKQDEANMLPIFEMAEKLQNKIYDYGYSKKNYLSYVLKQNACMSDNDKAITILPMGQIGKCEHYNSDGFCGSIYKDKFDEDVIAQFKEQRQRWGKCNSCVLYPICFRLKVCSEKNECVEIVRQQSISRFYTSMENSYNYFINHNEDLYKDETEIQCEDTEDC